MNLNSLAYGFSFEVERMLASPSFFSSDLATSGEDGVPDSLTEDVVVLVK